MARPTLVGTAANTGNAGYTVDVSGIDIQEDDLILVFTGYVVVASNTVPTVSGNVSGNFQLVGAESTYYNLDTWDCQCGLYWQVAGATADATLTIPRSGTAAAGGGTVVQVWRGCDPSNPISLSALATIINSSRVDPAAILPVNDLGDTIVIAAGMGCQPPAGSAFTIPSGMSNGVSVYSNGSTSGAGVWIASADWDAGDGAYDPAAVTGGSTSTSSSGVARTVALVPLFDEAATPVIFLEGREDAADVTTSTFSDVNFGPPRADRQIAAFIGARCAVAPTSVTIGGVSATLVEAVEWTVSGSTRMLLYVADVPSGTSGSVVASWGATTFRTGLEVYALYGLDGKNPDVVAELTADGTFSPFTLASAADVIGAVFSIESTIRNVRISGASATIAAGSPTISYTASDTDIAWTGLTEDDDRLVEAVGGSGFLGAPGIIVAYYKAAGGQTLLPSLYTHSPVFYTHSVGGLGVELTPSLYTNTPVFYSPTVAPGTVTLTAGLFTHSPAFYSPTVDAGIALEIVGIEITPKAAASSTNAALPAGTAAGDRVMIVHVNDNNPASDVSNAHQLLDYTYDGSSILREAWTRIVTSTDVSNGYVTVTHSNQFATGAMIVAVFRNAGAPNVISAGVISANNSAITITNPSTDIGAKYLAIGVLDDDHSTISSWPTDYTDNREEQQFGNVEGGGTLALAIAPAFPTNTNTFTFNSSDGIVGFVFEIPFAIDFQELQPALFTHNAEFYAPTVGAAALELTPGLFEHSPVFYSPTVTPAATAVTVALFTHSAEFYSPTVTATNTLTPGLFAHSPVFYAPSISVGSVVLLPELFTHTATFYTHSIFAGQPIEPELFVHTAAFYAPTVTTSNTLTPGLFTHSAVFYSPTVKQNLASGLFVHSAVFYAPTVAPGTATLYPELFIHTAVFPVAAISQTIYAGLFTHSPVFYLPRVVLRGDSVAPSERITYSVAQVRASASAVQQRVSASAAQDRTTASVATARNS